MNNIGGMFLVKRHAFPLKWATALFSTLDQAQEFIDDRAEPEDWEIVLIDEVLLRPRKLREAELARADTALEQAQAREMAGEDEL